MFLASVIIDAHNFLIFGFLPVPPLPSLLPRRVTTLRLIVCETPDPSNSFSPDSNYICSRIPKKDIVDASPLLSESEINYIYKKKP